MAFVIDDPNIITMERRRRLTGLATEYGVSYTTAEETYLDIAKESESPAAFSKFGIFLSISSLAIPVPIFSSSLSSTNIESSNSFPSVDKVHP